MLFLFQFIQINGVVLWYIWYKLEYIKDTIRVKEVKNKSHISQCDVDLDMPELETLIWP